MDIGQARELLREGVESSDYMHSPDTFLAHSEGVAQQAYDVGMRVEVILGMDPEKLRIAGLLHDIGRFYSTSNHEVIGANILRAMGHPHIARIVEPHGFISESIQVQQEQGIAVDYIKYLNPKDFLPKTLPQLLLVYCDMCNDNGERVTPRERLDLIKERYKGDPLFEARVNRAEPRILYICDTLERKMSI